jgi:hypothetical protein
LPTLTGLAAEKKYDDFRATLRQGVSHLLFLNLLASVLLVTLSEPIIRVIYERGRFAADGSTDAVAFALACLAPGLVMFSTVNVLARAFYALGDTRTPMLVSVFCLVLNLVFTVVLLILFKPGYKQGGLGVANTLSALFNAAPAPRLARTAAGLEPAAGGGGGGGIGGLVWRSVLGRPSRAWQPRIENRRGLCPRFRRRAGLLGCGLVAGGALRGRNRKTADRLAAAGELRFVQRAGRRRTAARLGFRRSEPARLP